MSGHADVSVMPGQSVTIYPNGDITMNSNNDINVGNEAKNLVIYGTSSIGQNFTFGSNVQVYGCIYAPNAAITLNSDADILGAMIGDTIELDSNAEVHYDESPAQVGGTGGLRVNRWKELQTAAERQAYEANLAFEPPGVPRLQRANGAGRIKHPAWRGAHSRITSRDVRSSRGREASARSSAPLGTSRPTFTV